MRCSRRSLAPNQTRLLLKKLRFPLAQLYRQLIAASLKTPQFHQPPEMRNRIIQPRLIDFRGSVRNSRFAIAGAGNQARRILSYLSPLKPCCITDNDPSRWGSDILGAKVLAPSEAGPYQPDIMILSSLTYFVMAWQHGLKERSVVFIISPVELIYGYS